MIFVLLTRTTLIDRNRHARRSSRNVAKQDAPYRNLSASCVRSLAAPVEA